MPDKTTAVYSMSTTHTYVYRPHPCTLGSTCFQIVDDHHHHHDDKNGKGSQAYYLRYNDKLCEGMQRVIFLNSGVCYLRRSFEYNSSCGNLAIQQHYYRHHHHHDDNACGNALTVYKIF